MITALRRMVSVCHPDYIYSEILSGKVGGEERKGGGRDEGRKEERKRRKEGREGGERKEGKKRREMKKNNSTELTCTCALHLVSPITSFRLQHSIVTRNLAVIPTINLAQIAHFTAFHADIPMPVSVFLHLAVSVSLSVSLCV